MRRIDLESWPRRGHFEIFNALDYPHVGLCAPVDVTRYRHAVKEHGISFNTACVYLITRVANEIPEFRQRIRGGEVIEHDVVDASTTVMSHDELFSFCLIPYTEDIREFAAAMAIETARVRGDPQLTDGEGGRRDDLLFMTAIPWVSFTSFMHPVHLSPIDSIPRFAWGRFHWEGNTLLMPLNVQGHHALMDGLHIGRFYAKIGEYLKTPDLVLDGTRKTGIDGQAPPTTCSTSTSS